MGSYITGDGQGYQQIDFSPSEGSTVTSRGPQPGGGVAVGSAANFIPGFVSGGLNYLSQESANRANADLAREQRAWASEEARIARESNAEQAWLNRKFQESMSNTAYQRAVEDMKAAGINPMLAYMKGGASTPGGAQGSASAPSGTSARVESSRIGDAFKESLATAMQVSRFEKEMQAADAAIDLDKARAAGESAATEVAKATAKQQKATLPAVEAEARARKKHGEIDETLAPVDAGIDRLGRVVNTATSAVRGLFSGGTGKSVERMDDGRLWDNKTKNIYYPMRKK